MARPPRTEAHSSAYEANVKARTANELKKGKLLDFKIRQAKGELVRLDEAEKYYIELLSSLKNLLVDMATSIADMANPADPKLAKGVIFKGIQDVFHQIDKQKGALNRSDKSSEAEDEDWEDTSDEDA